MKLYAWIRPGSVEGDHPIPSSEETYNAHADLIDGVLPLNGGRLQADGTWLQEGGKINPDFPQNLPGLAVANGHLYMPVMYGGDSTQIVAVLDSPTLQETAADNLIELATVARFDSPWDGVYFDLEGIPSAYKDQLSRFLLLLSYRIRKEGLLCGVSVRGRTYDIVDYDDAYSYDFSVVAQVADIVDVRLYGYWQPIAGIVQNRSLCPYWWAKQGLEYALEQGIPPQRLLFGLGNFSRYYPTGDGNNHDITYANAMELADDVNAPIQWIERNQFGLVRERLIDLGQGHIWVHDGDTARHSLDLVDEYGLAGVALFAPGMGDAYHWDVLAEWKG